MAEQMHRRVTGAVGEGRAVGGTKRRPYGSTARTRQMVLAALGVAKVATAEQIRQLMCPGTASAQTVRNGCLDLGRDGLVESLGSAGRTNAAGNLVSEKLWNLTGPGLEAAAAVLDRPVREMGGTARGAARSGAKHAVKVTDTLAAFLQTPPEPTRPVPRKQPQTATTARSSAPTGNDTGGVPEVVQERPQGLGQISSWATEVVLPVSGTLTTPGRNSPRADAVLTAPEERLPVMFVEVDNGTENPLALAHKAGRYREFFRRTVKPPSPLPTPHAQKRESVPMWETLYGPLGREGYPPLAIVFTKQVGSTAMNNRINSVMRLAEEYWAGQYCEFATSYGSDERDGYTDYTDAVPILVTTLDRLREHGPLGPVWFRFGHPTWQTFADALDDPDDERAFRLRQRRRDQLREQQREQEEQRRERERQEERERWAAREAAAEAAGEPDPVCQECQGPLESSPFEYDPQEEKAPPADGVHCAGCRIQMAEPTGRFGRVFRRLVTGDERYPRR
ncbi:replication-relaxation family protein [Streptomyces sp. MCA2]|uniref:replication-relaxation family protein n=1 Tax=Streptomyces sp. MCA2 TaxID=2944805 RepID=UPI0020201E90|nr:replication-relaxation family protein [Streptomyces sp. MCA2]MCL7496081.1 replication-relaxation family protein [Streptomyces sp. MCA2]